MNNVDYNDDIKIGFSVSATPDATPTVKVYAGGVLLGAATVSVSTGSHDYVAEFTMPSSSFLESPVDGLVISVRVDSVVNAVQLPSEYKQIGMFGLRRLQAIASSAQLIADDVATNAAAAGLHATTDGLITTVDTVVDLILADTNELQTDWVDAGRLDNLLDAAAASAGGALGDSTLTVTVQKADGTKIRGAKVTIEGTNYTGSGPSTPAGIVTFSLTDTAYNLVTTPPSGYATPAVAAVTVDGATAKTITLAASTGSGGEGYLG